MFWQPPISFFRPGLLKYKTEMNAMIDASMQANNGVLKIRQADRKQESREGWGRLSDMSILNAQGNKFCFSASIKSLPRSV